METLGEKIYNLRKERDVSQEELAFALNTTRQTVSRWENNTVKPTYTNLECLCNFFNVSNKYFGTSDEEEAAPQLPPQSVQAAASADKFNRFVFILAVVMLVVCIVICVFTGCQLLSTSNINNMNVRIIGRFRYVGIACLTFGAVALVSLITLIVLYVKNKKKQKCNTVSGKM